MAPGQILGFDLDGTLYDEFDFIRQVYQPIAAGFAKLCARPPDLIYSLMLNRWLEKGSSYNRIFEEVLRQSGIKQPAIARAIQAAVRTFRAFKPALTLPARVEHLLNFASKDHQLFLVTDGQTELQWAKISSLGLTRWFRRENIAVSGDYGSGYQKPSVKLLRQLELFPQRTPASGVVYFGDRSVDKKFAAKARFTFIYVHCMIPIARPRP